MSLLQIIYERGNLSQNTLKILTGMLPTAIKEPLQKEVQFWSATKILKVSKLVFNRLIMFFTLD